MFGKNPKRKPIKSDGNSLEVQEIFKTFQGEGPFVGYPSIFIRLGGCNLDCNFCDTEFEDFKSIQLSDILQKADNLSGRMQGNFTHKLAVITGGEPFRQNIKPLCEKLLSNGYNVQIETNGTLYQDLNDKVVIICSPKNNQGAGYSKIRDDLLKKVSAFKFIISSNDVNYQDIGEVGQNLYNIPVYVQPMDEYNIDKNKDNLKYTVNLAQNNGYIFCLQTHKIVGVD